MIPKKYAYLRTARLTQIIGDSLPARIVEVPSAYSHDELVRAVAEVEQLICPWPALRIQRWFWETAAGKTVSAAQWIVYGDEEVGLAKALRILWGGNSHMMYLRMYALVRDRRLRVYAYPPQARTGKEAIRFYFRRSELDKYMQEEGL